MFKEYSCQGRFFTGEHFVTLGENVSLQVTIGSSTDVTCHKGASATGSCPSHDGLWLSGLVLGGGLLLLNLECLAFCETLTKTNAALGKFICEPFLFILK